MIGIKIGGIELLGNTTGVLRFSNRFAQENLVAHGFPNPSSMGKQNVFPTPFLFESHHLLTLKKHQMVLFVAEVVGFELTVPCGTLVFKTSALDHYATPPYLFNFFYFNCVLSGHKENVEYI